MFPNDVYHGGERGSYIYNEHLSDEGHEGFHERTVFINLVRVLDGLHVACYETEIHILETEVKTHFLCFSKAHKQTDISIINRYA